MAGSRPELWPAWGGGFPYVNVGHGWSHTMLWLVCFISTMWGVWLLCDDAATVPGVAVDGWRCSGVWCGVWRRRSVAWGLRRRSGGAARRGTAGEGKQHNGS